MQKLHGAKFCQQVEKAAHPCAAELVPTTSIYGQAQIKGVKGAHAQPPQKILAVSLCNTVITTPMCYFGFFC